MKPKLRRPDDPLAPKYWVHETSGVLKPVVKAYLHGTALEKPQIDIMRAYLWQWVRSDVWGPSGALEALRTRVAAISTQQEIDGAIEAAVALGMDPL